MAPPLSRLALAASSRLPSTSQRSLLAFSAFRPLHTTPPQIPPTPPLTPTSSSSSSPSSSSAPDAAPSSKPAHDASWVAPPFDRQRALNGRSSSDNARDRHKAFYRELIPSLMPAFGVAVGVYLALQLYRFILASERHADESEAEIRELSAKLDALLEDRRRKKRDLEAAEQEGGWIAEPTGDVVEEGSQKKGGRWWTLGLI